MAEELVVPEKILENNNKALSEKMFITLLERYEKEKPVVLNDFLINQLELFGVYNQKQSFEVIQEISETIDLIAEKHNELHKARQNGHSRIEWLRDNLEKTANDYKIKDPKMLVQEVIEGLRKINVETIKELFDQEFTYSEPTMPSIQDLKIIDKKIVTDVVEEIKSNTLLSAISVEGIKIKIDPNHTDVKAIKDFFTCELHSPRDKEVSKIAATGLAIAREKKWMPILKGKTNVEIASMADKGVMFAKVAYKVAKGEISPTLATDFIIDRTAATVSTVVTKTCAAVGTRAGAVIGATIGSIFGPGGTAVGGTVGSFVGKVAGTAVGMAISTGVQKIAEKAKETVNKAWDGVKSVATNFVSGLKGLFG